MINQDPISSSGVARESHIPSALSQLFGNIEKLQKIEAELETRLITVLRVVPTEKKAGQVGNSDLVPLALQIHKATEMVAYLCENLERINRQLEL